MGYVQSTHEIVLLAVRVEEEGAKFYRKLGVISHTAAVRETFFRLAEDEIRHRSEFLRIAEGFEKNSPPEDFPINLVEIMGEAVREIQDFMKGLEPVDMDEVTLAKAFEIGLRGEKESIRVYTELRKVFHERFDIILEKIIAEEIKHEERLLNLKYALLG